MRNRAARRGPTTEAVQTTRGISRWTRSTNPRSSSLAVAWTYPTSDNISYVFNPVVVDNVIYVLARNNSLVALDATTGREIWIHEGLQGIAPRGINYWESKDRSDRRLLFQMNSYLQAIDAQTGKSITDIRQRRRRQSARRARPRSGDDRQDAVVEPRKGVREPHHSRFGAGRELHGACRRSARVRCRDRRAGVAVPHDPASGRVRLRDVASGCVEIHRRRQHVG